MEQKFKLVNSNDKGLKRVNCNVEQNGNKKIKLSNNQSKKKKKLNVLNGQKNGHSVTVDLNLQKQRKNLPVYKCRERLLQEIRKRETVIVLGETGCGKTTQIPQFIHALKLEHNGKIGITQPRRVAAISMAQRVSREAQCEVGGLVGYSVRFEDCTSKLTKIKYMTDGMLLREAMIDNLLMGYNVLILDEAHERTVHTDVLFGIIKQAQQTRKLRNLHKLKVIIMSATMDVDHFAKYFQSKVLYLEGRTFPITINHTKVHQEDYVHSCLVTIFQIHRTAPANEDILVFLTGQDEIESMAHSIRSLSKELPPNSFPLKVFPLYAGLPTQQQLDVFKKLPGGKRKIILSTNIAETSLTINGIKHVVDSGMVKARDYNSNTGFEILRVQNISQEQAWQRAGRAGRESAGQCYRLYTRNEFNLFLKSTVPEIQRCNLTSVIIQLLALDINILKFDFIDSPSGESIIDALNQLKQLNAITNPSSPKLTELGKKMSLLPLDPKYSKVILSAKEYKCLGDILSIVSILSCESIFHTPMSKKEQAIASREKYMSNLGDHISLLKIYRGFMEAENKVTFCQEHYLNIKNLKYAKQVRIQLADLCQRHDFGIIGETCGNDFDFVRKCLLTGLFMNIVELGREKKYVAINKQYKQTPMKIHPSSILHGTYPPYLLFSEVVMTGKCYLRTVTKIKPEWLEEVVPDYAKQQKFTHWIPSNGF